MTELNRCAVCGAPAKVRDLTPGRDPRWLCRDHIPDETAAEVLDVIDEARRKAAQTRH